MTEHTLITCSAPTTILGKTLHKHHIFSPTIHAHLDGKTAHYLLTLPSTHFGTELIKTSRCFAVNFLTSNYSSAVTHCTKYSGKHTNLFTETGFTSTPCNTIDCPHIAEAHHHIECEVTDIKDIGNHTLIIGQVLHTTRSKNL